MPRRRRRGGRRCGTGDTGAEGRVTWNPEDPDRFARWTSGATPVPPTWPSTPCTPARPGWRPTLAVLARAAGFDRRSTRLVPSSAPGCGSDLIATQSYATGCRPGRRGATEAWYIPDGFIDAPTSLAAGRRGGGRVGGLRPALRRDAGGQAGADGRPGGRLHLRGADAQLPGGRRHQRPPAGRGAGRRPGRALDRGVVRVGRARGPGAAVRRRRAVRARPQHREHGAGRGLRRLRDLPAGPAAAARHPRRRRRGVRGGRAPVGGARLGCSASSTPSAAPAGRRWAGWPAPWSASTS